ncbi:AAA family ATPase [Actinoplanes sp. NPDC026619]|uniref:AAA family ATPase n=1 Tax=Actinoplanes sp. NPDC026619 TaxID=3155798 RepID=UPI0033F2052B
MRRYIITGAPGAGKTTVLAGLRDRGYAVVGEAATDVIARDHAAGDDLQSRAADFLDAITELQRERQLRAVPADVTVQVFDRSPICTLALARYIGHPVTPVLAGEVERVMAAGIYQPRVFFVHLLGFITPTAARRITLVQSQRFAEFHVRAYRELGFELVDVPVATVEQRVELIDRHLRS